MTEISTSQLLQDLRAGVVDVEFTKQDGSIRKMKATLNSQYVTDTEFKGADQSISDQINVFDTELAQWRSFNISKLVSATPVNA